MSLRLAPAGWLLLPLIPLVLLLPAPAQDPSRGQKTSVNELSMEVAALRALHQLRINPEQLKMLKKLAPETSQRPGPRQRAKVSEAYAHLLIDLRTALADGTDDELISELEEKLDELTEDEAPELDDSVEMTDAARQRASALLRQFTARQLASYIALYGDDFPDPVELLRGALSRVRPLAAKEWKQLREEVSEEVGRLVAGLDPDRAVQIGDKVVQLLIQVRALTDDEFKTQRSELEKAARQIVGDISPLEVIRHQLEYALAELLSNPRLEAALDLRLKL
jgi:hypothetical protein